MVIHAACDDLHGNTPHIVCYREKQLYQREAVAIATGNSLIRVMHTVLVHLLHGCSKLVCEEIVLNLFTTYVLATILEHIHIHIRRCRAG